MTVLREWRRFLGFSLIAIMFILVSACAFAADRVKYCYDGDTFILESGEKVRLAGIDTPEVGHNGERNQYYAQKSRQMLMDLVQGKNVQLQSVGASASYGRSVVEVLLQDGRSVNEILVREGAAYFYYHKDLPKSYAQKLLKAQNQAIKEKKGMWAGVLAKGKSQELFTGNRNSKRFFSQDCKELQSVSKKNYVPFKNLTEAFEAGFAPVRACNIWPMD